MLSIKNWDITTLQVRVGDFQRHFGLSKDEAILRQGGLLLRDLVMESPPKTLASSQKKAEDFAKNVFAPMPRDVFTKSQRGGKNGITWLYSGPQFILGVNNEDYQPGKSASDLRAIYKTASRKGSFGKRYERIGKRGGQAAIRVKRMVVGRQNLRALIKQIRDSFGKLKGAWSEGWDFFGVKFPLPGWIRRHQGKGRGSYLLTKGEKSSLTLINRAHGVESEYSRRAITHALRRRAGAIQADIRNQIRGAYRKAGFRSAARLSLN